jgi:hypothetical protein
MSFGEILSWAIYWIILGPLYLIAALGFVGGVLLLWWIIAWTVWYLFTGRDLGIKL